MKPFMFKDLVLTILRKFNQIVLISVVLALVFALIGIGMKTQEAKDFDFYAYQEQLEQYDKSKKALQDNIAGVSRQLDALNLYTQTSLLFQIDPTNKPVSNRVLYIDTNYTVVPGMVYQEQDPLKSIVSFCKNLISDEALAQSTQKLLGKDVPIQSARELYTITSESDSSLLVLEATALDIETAKKIADLLETTVISAVGENFKNIDISVLSHSDSYILDTTRLVYRNDSLNALSVLNADIVAKTLELNKLSEPQNPTSNRIVVKSGVMWGLIGGFIGAFFSCLIALLMAVSNPKINYRSDIVLSDRVVYLGDFSQKKEGRGRV